MSLTLRSGFEARLLAAGPETRSAVVTEEGTAGGTEEGETEEPGKNKYHFLEMCFKNYCVFSFYLTCRVLLFLAFDDQVPVQVVCYANVLQKKTILKVNTLKCLKTVKKS